jgi:hypothetical protein
MYIIAAAGDAFWVTEFVGFNIRKLMNMTEPALRMCGFFFFFFFFVFFYIFTLNPTGAHNHQSSHANRLLAAGGQGLRCVLV